jgi:hypothetical protein
MRQVNGILTARDYIYVPLGAADQFSNLGHQDVHGLRKKESIFGGDKTVTTEKLAGHAQRGTHRHGLVVIVELHVEGLDALGVVRDDGGSAVHLLGDVPLVLGPQVVAPVGILLELNLPRRRVALKSSGHTHKRSETHSFRKTKQNIFCKYFHARTCRRSTASV